MVNELSSPAPTRTALVTGASRGIGKAIALGLAQAGVNVALVATDQGLLDAVATQIRNAGGGKVSAVSADITDPKAVEKAVASAVAELGPIDMLVNAAGIVDKEVAAWEADPEHWWRVFEVNVRGPFLMARALVPEMLEAGGGRIVDLSSGAASHSMEVASGYNASKTALLRLGEHLAITGGNRGLKVFEVAPGVVQTDMTASMDMHVDRTDWTPVEKTVEMVLAIAQGELDGCSGWFIRVSEDTPKSLKSLAATAAGNIARRLRVLPAHPEDPMADLLTGR
jgi:NAD(P)-dependent dehydrogenase (short-subunit alcohol dehydrogenase family)